MVCMLGWTALFAGTAAPDAHVAAAGEVEQGEDGDVEWGAALIVLVEPPGALVAVNAENDRRDGVGVPQSTPPMTRLKLAPSGGSVTLPLSKASSV
jgi:hypothetical protein